MVPTIFNQVSNKYFVILDDNKPLFTALNFQSPIGKLIVLSYEEPNILGNSVLKEKLTILINLIISDTKKKGVLSSSRELQNQLFDIRFDLISYLADQPDIVHLIEVKILEEISNHYFLKGRYEDLGLIAADSLEVYYKIVSHLSTTIAKQFSSFSEHKEEIPSFEGLKLFLTNQPFMESQLLVQWIEASLRFDYSLIMADLLIDNQIILDKAEIDSLTQIMRVSIIDFSSISAVGDLWKIPNENIPFVEDIKLKILELKNNPPFVSTSKKKSAHIFSGLWTKDEATRIEKAIQEGCEQIDEDGWK